MNFSKYSLNFVDYEIIIFKTNNIFYEMTFEIHKESKSPPLRQRGKISEEEKSVCVNKFQKSLKHWNH